MKTRRHYDTLYITAKLKNLIFEQLQADLTFMNKSTKSPIRVIFKIGLG